MTSATLLLSVVQKRMLTKTEAAHHCGRSVKRFEAECLIAPVKFPNGGGLQTRFRCAVR